MSYPPDRFAAGEDFRRSLYVRDRGQCYACERWLTLDEAQFDHLIPYSSGGPTVAWNLATVCASCNYSKSGRLLTRAWLERRLRTNPDLAARRVNFRFRAGRHYLALLHRTSRGKLAPSPTEEAPSPC